MSLFAFLVTFLFQCAHEKEIKQKKVYPQSNILEGVQSAACPIYICKMRVPEIKTKSVSSFFELRLVILVSLYSVTYYFVGRLSPLPDATLSHADEWEKVLGLFTLRRRKKQP